MMAKFVRIVSNGLPTKTQIFDPQGNEILMDGIRNIHWEIAAGKAGIATIEIVAEMEVLGELKVVTGPPRGANG